ncbi:MAG: hypothetical protein V4819_22970 [Verrucomicrobiota bacterium]
MKPILIATAILAAVGFAIVQQSKLSDLKAETARLEAGKTPSAVKRADRSLPAAEVPRQATAAQIELVRGTMAEALVAFQKRTSHPDPERMKQLLLAVRDFSGKDIARLLALLRDDPRLAGLEADKIVDACREIFSEAAPFAWRDYLESHRDLPDWQKLFDSAVSNCLKADGKRAIEQFEEETARGNRDFATSGIRTGVLLKLVASDPDKMLAMAASPEFAADPDALAHLGGFVDDQLKKPEDHLRFLAALRRATGKNPDSPLWQTVRKDYVREMSNQLQMWPFEPMKTLVDGEFTREEKWLVAEQASHRGDLEDKSKWADWFLGIDPAEWDRWAAGQPQRLLHPVIGMLGDWGRNDVAAASAWVEKLPPGDLRSKAVLEHAWSIADRDPDRAAGYLGELPESKGKQNLVKKIGKAKR